ncbi:MAG: hypothetical protein AAFX94_17020, partial [Myxococcota bacterium]
KGDHPVIAESLRTLSATPQLDASLTNRIRSKWRDSFREDPEAFFDGLYRALTRMLDTFDGADTDQGALLLNTLDVCGSTKYAGYNVSHLEPIFATYSPRLVHAVDRLLGFQNKEFVASENPRRLGDTGEIIEGIFQLYFYHLTYPKLERRRDVLGRIRPYYLKYNDRASNIVIALLGEDASGIGDMAALISHGVEHPSDDNAGAFILGDMLSRHAKREDFEHKHAPKILTAVLEVEREWSANQIRRLVEQLVLKPLDIDNDTSPEAEKQRMVDALEWAKKYPDLKAEYEGKIARIESDFDGYLADRLAEAATLVRKSKVRARCVRLLMDRFDGSPELEPLRTLLEAVNSGSGKRTYTLNQTPTVRFADEALKLMVIEELMYRRGTLRPKFDVNTFANEYEGRDISVRDDGDAVIPEAWDYLMALDIPQELLNTVTELTLDDGCGGGMQVVTQYHPYFDPGCGDEVLQPTEAMLDDLKSLPNLESIRFIGTQAP